MLNGATWLRSTRWLTGTVVAVLLVVLVWAMFVPVPDWLAHHDVGSVTGPLHETALDNARGRLLTLSAGLVAVVALIFTARTFHLSREGQVTDRYTKAVEQLGSDKLDVRIGGIYALERVARDSPRDHPAVMEVLTAFIREHSWEPWPLPRTEEEEDADLVEFTRPDVQAALTVVVRRDVERDARTIDLTRADLTRADLGDARLARAILAGARLTGADLHSATLTAANLRGTDLRHARVEGADLESADLTSADLTGAFLLGANLTTADLTSAYLTGTILTQAILFYADLARGRLVDACLVRADLRNARLSSADLRKADLTDADLAGASAADADLTGAVIGGARLADVTLTGAILRDAILFGADLTGAHLARATFTGRGEFTDANFTGADLTGADLTGAFLAGAILTGANLAEANLSGAVWPESIDPPEGWLDAGSGRLQRAAPGSASEEGV